MVGVLVKGGNVLDDLAGMSYQVAELAGWLGSWLSLCLRGACSCLRGACSC